jgi:hypothetical protein
MKTVCACGGARQRCNADGTCGSDAFALHRHEHSIRRKSVSGVTYLSRVAGRKCTAA